MKHDCFVLERHHRWLFMAAPWLMLGLAGLCAALPWLPSEKPGDPTALLVLALAGALIFGSLAWYSFRVLHRLHLASVSVDDEGLWPTALPRAEALVHWDAVARLRERPTLQRLELLAASGTVLAKLEYQLQDFERLRAFVVEHSRHLSHDRRDSFSMPSWHHAFNIGSMLAFSVLGAYVGKSSPLVGYAGMTFVVAMIGWEYWMLPYGLRLTKHTLELDLPARHRSIRRELIAEIRLVDDIVNHMRRPHVLICLHDETRPIQLKGLQSQAIDLFQALDRWWRPGPHA